MPPRRAPAARRATATSDDDDDEFAVPAQTIDAPALRRGRRGAAAGVAAAAAAAAAVSDSEYHDADEGGEGAAASDPDAAGPSSRGAKRRRGSGAPVPASAGAGAPAADDEAPIATAQADLHRAEQLVQRYRTAADGALERCGATGVTRQALDALVGRAARHLLFRHAERPGVPVPRAELSKLVGEALREAAGPARKVKPAVAGVVIAEAQAALLEGLGLEARELTKAPPRGANRALAAAGEGSKHLVLRSALPPPLRAALLPADEAASARRGLLAAVLGLLQLGGGRLAADDLWRHLAALGVAPGAEHPRLGLPAAALEELVRARYLHAERAAGAEGPEVFYSAGEAAADEVGVEAVEAWVAREFAAGGA
jgi:hypothetical protein